MENLRTIDVLIIGAGPAGTVCGSLLKQAGVECAVVDHATFPREKVCGGGLTVKAWRLLDELMPGIKYEYRSINHMRVQFEDDKVCDFHSEYEIRMTRRTDFDYDLLKYYQSHGGELIKGSFARFEKQADGRILVTLKSGMQFSCRYLIAADGANSMVRKQMTGAPKMHALFLEYYVEGEHEEAQRYFEKQNVKSVKPFRRFQMFDDKRYVLVACTFLKSEDDRFNEALYELQSDMLILGYRDYEEFCKKAFVTLKLIPA